MLFTFSLSDSSANSSPVKMAVSDASAEVIAGNDDLLTQILLLLPPKPLIRFKSVSKHWRSLISSPRFTSLHTLRRPNPAPSGLLLRRSPSEVTLLPLMPAQSSISSPLGCFDAESFKILQSCNGLLLCSSFPEIGLPRRYSVCNPTTNRFFALPPVSSPSCTVYGLNLAFDPSRSPDYKVVCVRSTAASIYLHQIEIYDSETGAWRLSGSPFVAPFDMVFDAGVFWNGRVHWISPTGKTLYFDVHRETTGLFPAPPFSDRWGKRRFRYFGESSGHLHLIEIYDLRCARFRVFEMNKDYSSWRVRYEVDLDRIVKDFPVMIRRYSDDLDSSCLALVILSVVEEEKEEDSSILLHIPGKIVSYKFKSKSYQIVADLKGKTSSSLQFGWLDAYQYIETLAFVG